MGFFLAGPLCVTLAGVVLMLRGDEGMNSVWGPTNVAVVHLGVVGFLLLVMTGALYQMLPVVAGALVPAVRLGHGVQVLLLGGAALLVTAQATGTPGAFAWASGLMAAGLLLFLLPASWAVLHSRVGGATAWGLRLALLAMACVALAGLRLATTRAGADFQGDWMALRWAHAHLGFLAWTGGLVAAVSWQVLPMFFLAPSPTRAVPWGVLAGVVTSLLGLVSVYVFTLPPGAVVWMALPGALAVWLVQPGWALWALHHRKRKRKDATTWFWWLAMGCAPLCLLAGGVVAFVDAPAVTLLYGLWVLWAWAGALVHGMLTRIVPFLVWLHRCAPLVGTVPVPSARELTPDREVALGFWLHLGTLVCGVIAALSMHALAWRVFGLGLLSTGIQLELSLLATLRRGWRVRAPG
jgi:hypothetical protein